MSTEATLKAQHVLIGHDPDARCVHSVNTQLLMALFGPEGCLRTLLIEPSGWIINVLYVHGPADGAPMLRTSSTLHRGRLYDHRTMEDEAVHEIDQTVSLATSISGRSILAGRPIWLAKGEFEAITPDSLVKRYRPFSAVGVDTAGFRFPKAELVFPIAMQHLNATRAFGVLNLEFFGEWPPFPHEYFSELPNEDINELLCDILHVHSGFLKVAIDLMPLLHDTGEMVNGPTDPALQVPEMEDMLELHRWALDCLIRRNDGKLRRVAGKIADMRLDPMSGTDEL